jgi:hypothetical protein
MMMPDTINAVLADIMNAKSILRYRYAILFAMCLISYVNEWTIQVQPVCLGYQQRQNVQYWLR